MTGTGSGDEPQAPLAYLDMPVSEFLAALADGTAVPAGGSAAAVCVALGGCLTAMAARLSARQLGAEVASELAAEAHGLATAAARQVQADAESVRQLLAGRPGGDMSAAADVPLQVMELAAQIAHRAARLAADGNPNLRGDAVTAVLLADAGARAASVLVEIDLASVPDDRRGALAGRLLADLASLVARQCAPGQLAGEGKGTG